MRFFKVWVELWCLISWHFQSLVHCCFRCTSYWTWYRRRSGSWY